MTDDQLLQALNESGFFLDDGRANPQALRRLTKFPEIKKVLLTRVSFLPETASFSQIVHALRYNLTSIPTCPVCNNNIKFDKPSSSYPTTCSVKCGAIHSPLKTFKRVDVTKNPKILSKRIRNRKDNFRTGDRAVLCDERWLRSKHVEQRYSIGEIARELVVTPQTVKNALTEYNIQSPPQQELREASNLRKYGVTNPGLLPEVRERARKSDYGNKAGGWKSSGEKEIFSFVQSLLPDTEIQENTQRVISPYELDIYIPSHSLAIEYCGLYWHSDKFKENYYHRNKLRQCQEKGIRLLTIFEDEWRDKQEQVKNKIKILLNKDDRPSVYARHTHVVAVTTKTKNKFLDEHHIQGTGPGSITYGLSRGEDLVAVMTFIKRADGKYELNRYATSCSVVGGFSKLLKHFQRNHDWTEIVSFADLRISDGDLYEKTGWTLDKILPPDYFWVKNGQRFHKFNFRHKFLAERLETYDPSLPENENCKNNGYLKIYNCGLNRYILTRAES